MTLNDKRFPPQLKEVQAHIADAATLTGGETPTEAEHNALAAKVNAILAVLEAWGLTKSA